MITRYQDNCKFCANYKGNRKCSAFEQIPDDLWSGENDHNQPYPGDNGIQYEYRRLTFPEMTDELLAEINKESD